MATVKKYGIDVSYYQGTIDWAAVKAAGVEWCILRGGFGNSNVDTQFVNNITGAIAAGIPQIGVYWFSYAYDAYTAGVEVDKCLETIAPYKQHINLPVWFDFESASYSYVQRTRGESLTAWQIQDIARAWCGGVISAGYAAGIYSNKSDGDRWFKLANGQYLWQELGCEFWYARYGANNETSLFITPAFEATALSEHPEMNIFQYSDVGRVAGINSQRVDLNIRYEESADPQPDPPAPQPTERNEVTANNIEYVAVRDADFNIIGIIDNASSIIWHSVYYGVGDFEIYIKVTQRVLDMLQIGYYITRANDVEVGIIEAINITDNLQDGKMIVASGRFAKSILDRRHIYKLSGTVNTPTILRGNVETNIRQTVSDNAISCTDNRRNIPVLELGALSGIGKIIVDDAGAAAQKQVSYQNLLTYTDSVLQEYNMASLVILNEDRAMLQYIVYEGADRSVTNGAGNVPVIFSREYDNLSDSTYTYDTAAHKNVALIGGAGEDIDRFYTLLAGSETGLDRRETWIDASSVNREYDDESGTKKTYSDADYIEMLKTEGKQGMAEMKTLESFSGTIDITNGNYIYNRDFALGDVVTVQDNDIGKYVNVRILEVTEVQDESGYKIEAKYDV